MNELVMIQNQQVVTDSRNVAEHFGKRHDHVCRDIQNILGGLPKIGDTPKMFHEATYTNEQNGQSYPMYLMNRDGFSLLVMGFTGKKALEWKLKYINAFNEMERKLKEQAPAQLSPEEEMARGLLAAQKMIAEKDARIKELTPKGIFADAVSASETSILIGDLAKLIKQNGVDMGQKRLFAWMRANGYLIKQKGHSYNLPTQRSMNAGWFEIKETTINNPDGSIRVTKTTKVTGKGQVYFVNLFLKMKATDEVKEGA